VVRVAGLRPWDLTGAASFNVRKPDWSKILGITIVVSSDLFAGFDVPQSREFYGETLRVEHENRIWVKGMIA